MKVIIIAGKVVFAVIWLGLFAILGGATGELSSQSIGLLSVLLAVLVIMHLLLLGVFVGTMKQHLSWKKGDSWQILAFGIFAWLSILQRPKQDQD
ncbi:DUF1145 domain-containing protein [Idiomarina sp.]|uniref:DUF1145 domain-containing protein n=1 Tax=Idiomarina sp. TaxID=1874361 RepID=UPI002619D9B1|nr:DUF1145 domain-containing protein [Idiomarina sp.]